MIIGIDEAGRGPLAGPVTVGVFGADKKMGTYIRKYIFASVLRDSKKLSAKKREEIYKKFLKLKKQGKVFFGVCNISNKIIDSRGISEAIKRGIAQCLNLTPHPSPKGRRGEEEKPQIRLDGLLKAPPEFKNQKTIIKGDEKDVFIACASIVAKVSRDRLMRRLSKKYPQYGFEIHKGYGTKLHRDLIKKHGFSPIHRLSFCTKLTGINK
jgi:ribonuclease HII